MQSETAQILPRTSGRARWLAGGLLGVMLAMHLVLLIYTACAKSATYDEGPHLAAGLAYWREGEMSIYNLSPPLIRYIAAAPAYFSGADVPVARRHRSESAGSRAWNFFDEIEDANPGQIRRYVLWGRLMLLPLSVLSAGLIYVWSRSLYGVGGGLLSCAAWCFNPLVLAHGSTLGTDIGCAATMLLSAWSWQRFSSKPTPSRAASAAAAFAVALTVKFTALLLIPLLVVMAGLQWLRNRGSLQNLAVGLTLCATVGFLGFNAIYRFRHLGDRLGGFDFQSSTLQSMQRFLPAGISVPFHRDAIYGFDAQKYEAEAQYPAALFDKGYFGSDWRFYPIQFFILEPVGLLFLTLIAMTSFFAARLRPAEWPLLSGLLICLGGICLFAQINISLRYLLPAYCFASVMLGRLASWRAARGLIAVATVLMIAETVAAAPRYQSFANWFLRDSRWQAADVDWGQSLIAVGEWQKANPGLRSILLYGGTVRPAEYGVVVSPDNLHAEADVLIVSKLLLNGFPVRTNEGFLFLRCWRELRTQRPLADLDGMSVYTMTQVRQTGVTPWVRPVQTWADALTDPKMIPFRNRPHE